MSLVTGYASHPAYHSIARDFYQQHQQQQQQQHRYTPHPTETRSGGMQLGGMGGGGVGVHQGSMHQQQQQQQQQPPPLHAGAASSGSINSSSAAADASNVAYFQNLMFCGGGGGIGGSGGGGGGGGSGSPYDVDAAACHRSSGGGGYAGTGIESGAELTGTESGAYVAMDTVAFGYDGLSTAGGAGMLLHHGGTGDVRMMQTDADGVPRVRTVKRRVSSNRKERRRTHSINTAFSALRGCIPNVPADTKLSKIKTLRLATSYIAYLMDILNKDDPKLAEGGFKADITRKIESREEKRKRESEVRIYHYIYIYIYIYF